MTANGGLKTRTPLPLTPTPLSHRDFLRSPEGEGLQRRERVSKASAAEAQQLVRRLRHLVAAADHLHLHLELPLQLDHLHQRTGRIHVAAFQHTDRQTVAGDGRQGRSLITNGTVGAESIVMMDQH